MKAKYFFLVLVFIFILECRLGELDQFWMTSLLEYLSSENSGSESDNSGGTGSENSGSESDNSGGTGSENNGSESDNSGGTGSENNGSESDNSGGTGSENNGSGFVPAVGELDPTFDTDGIVTTNFSGGSTDYAYAIAIQPDGKILVAGVSINDFALVRYNSDGTLDTSFDTDGKVTTNINGGSYEVARAIAIQPNDGKILLAGVSINDFALVRYNSDGTLDTSFDTDGIVTTNIGGSNDVAYAIAIQPNDGKILVAGYSNASGNSDFALVRYNSDGTLDTSFDTDGIVTTNFSGVSNDYAYAIALQPDGKILVAGRSNAYSGNNDFALVRYR